MKNMELNHLKALSALRCKALEVPDRYCIYDEKGEESEVHTSRPSSVKTKTIKMLGSRFNSSKHPSLLLTSTNTTEKKWPLDVSRISNGIVSYSMPQGDKRGSWEFFDNTYDGYWESELTRGLGQLTDGKFGPENFKMGYYESERGQGWVGWRNDTRGGQPVEIKFEFDKVREFSAIHIFCNNQFSKDVQRTLESQL
ncbi:hypothetical protein M8J76_012537 [Diaphorina citri]|nr:hypothetical protein M8J76_012537 [Diaphorina citri]